MRDASRERIYVVGLGASTCLGPDMDTTWRALVAGRSGIRRHESLGRDAYLQDVAGLVETLEPDGGTGDRNVARLSARFILLALKSAREAWADAGLMKEGSPASPAVDPGRVAIAVGSAFGGVDFLEAQQARMKRRNDLSVSPFLVPGLLINQAAGQVAQNLHLHGPSVAPSNACATGGHAIILGAMALRAGDADLALCGASESAFTPAIVNGFATMKALFQGKPGDRAEADPSQASRPFSVDRDGFVMSEGAAMLALATGSAVERLGLEPRAELLGYAMNTDGYHIAMPHQDRIVECLRLALAKAGLEPTAIDYYNAHGTSTALNDRVETASVKEVFGDHARKLPISSIKGALGHGLGAAAAIEAAVCVRALSERCIPPTINHRPDPELDLDYVPGESRPAELKIAASASFGFGGTNNVLILGRP
ncbi:3-oxoacyl-[acyl-carrier-protein] synthase 2 [Aquisphaera giovannonii]|uniref:3-oxoacyl-[acyl-carrier-protein] synthase 2 n=1 Tax=Aquisphaera giovannonii TaxID=406548 RepID=A0A5B9VZI7_9BACT|nr:beta-ketoacyl-[acyl-carrier-protein] synthase family protein [Aquisphaera giovannonii]QEH33708.1 3-oxoacyl-[acyl-carrier-protein] synthase 2 [Aquisphaera giovannonii]